MKKIQYELEKIADQIYHLIIPDQYDMCMVFWRVQEFYESSYEEVCGKHITLLEFMDIYSRKKGGGCFTYPVEWGGFNIPSSIVEKCYIHNKEKIKADYNFYDSVIIDTHNKIKNNDKKYYLIGTTGFDEVAKPHEIAHALYFINEDYQKEVKKVLQKIPDKYYKKMKSQLSDMGYADHVIDDEINAYLSTGDNYFWEYIKPTKILLKIEKELANIFAKYETTKNVEY